MAWLPVGIPEALAGLEPVLPVMTVLSLEAIVSCSVLFLCVEVAFCAAEKDDGREIEMLLLFDGAGRGR